MSDEMTLFEMPGPEDPKPRPATRPEQARVYQPIRDQLEWAPRSLDSLLSQEHVARTIWAMLERLDLAAFYGSIKAVMGQAGHPATDPQVLLAIWVLATTEGIGSARQIDRLCDEHDAYRWLRGGVPINYHMLSDFRVANQGAMDDLLTKMLASMICEDLVKLNHVAHDGMRTRASAGSSSFHRKRSLEECLTEAQAQVVRLAQEREHPDPTKVTERQRAARERAAKERLTRVGKAVERLPEIQAIKERQRYKAARDKKGKVSEARVSTTDDAVQVMKMPDGGFRPALNVELATDVDSQVIVGVDVINVGSDGGQALPMAEKVITRTGRIPKAYLIDGSFAKLKDITGLERLGITVYAPTEEPNTQMSGRTREMPRRDDTPEVAAWRQRMETEEAKDIYRERAATAECVNARGRALGLQQFTVRGVTKALSVVLLVALTHNLLRWITLATQAARG
jgi:transposase